MPTVARMEPGDLHGLVQDVYNARDVDALVALYEPDARIFGPEGPVQGHDAIRKFWEDSVALDATGEIVTQYALIQGDIALLSNRWTMQIGDDQVSATTAEVAHRQLDGSWLYMIDNPDGASTGVLADAL